RSPCPAINSLANHGYLPRHGQNITLVEFIKGFKDGFNFDRAFTAFSVGLYQPFTSTGSISTLNLNDLDHHDLAGEHDGSLSRNDLYFGDNHSFNKSIWDTVAAHFKNDTISIPTAARARKERFAAAAAINPNFTASETGSMGETALYLTAMRGQNVETKTDFVEVFFREERIPFNEGWRRSNHTTTLGDLGELGMKIAAAT
ncbi:MAG: hypothetical protein Q9224_007243, partial [Gallowayella concinna]